MVSSQTTMTRAGVQAKLAEVVVLPDGTFPLQTECWCMAYAPYSPESDHGKTPQCTDGWLFNDAEDALTEAIRAKGWILDVFADPSDEGDWVIIYRSPIDDNPATVKPSEGLRGRAAVEQALLRAVEQEE